jgi:hypothetical protein
MLKVWSELRVARLREIAADVATAAWVWFWGSLAFSLYSLIVGFAEAGRLVRGGGQGLQEAGVGLSERLRNLPLVGEGVADALLRGFAGASTPIVSAGTELETFVTIVALTLGLLLAAVPLVPWLTRYLPWRAARLRRVRAAHSAIRVAPRPALTADSPEVRRILAARAINRLDWSTLLEYTPDPIGDWQRGQHDRLARAELEQAGLRP